MNPPAPENQIEAFGKYLKDRISTSKMDSPLYLQETKCYLRGVTNEPIGTGFTLRNVSRIVEESEGFTVCYGQNLDKKTAELMAAVMNNIEWIAEMIMRNEGNSLDVTPNYPETVEPDIELPHRGE